MMDTMQLWNAYKLAPTADLKKEIMSAYTNLVHYVIHKSKFVNLDILDTRDYFQFGIEGLSEAVDRFDPEYGTKFETYAIQRIRGKIMDELRKIQIKPRIKGADGSPDIYFTNVSLNQPVDDDDGYMLYEVLPDESETPNEVTEKNEAKEFLMNAIKNLEERDRMILTLYYFENLNYKEIAHVLNITVSRVSQIHSRIISSLKTKLVCLQD